MLQCLSDAIKELGWLFPLCYPQGTCNVFLQDHRMAALPFHSHRAAPKQKELFLPLHVSFPKAPSPKREVSFLKTQPTSRYILHDQLVLVCLVFSRFVLKFTAPGKPLIP